MREAGVLNVQFYRGRKLVLQETTPASLFYPLQKYSIISYSLAAAVISNYRTKGASTISEFTYIYCICRHNPPNIILFSYNSQRLSITNLSLFKILIPYWIKLFYVSYHFFCIIIIYMVKQLLKKSQSIAKSHLILFMAFLLLQA